MEILGVSATFVGPKCSGAIAPICSNVHSLAFNAVTVWAFAQVVLQRPEQRSSGGLPDEDTKRRRFPHPTKRGRTRLLRHHV